MMKMKKFILTLVFMFGILQMNINQAYAASFNLGLSVKNNGNGTLTATVGGSIVGKVSVEVKGSTQTVFLETIGQKKSFTFNTGEGTFTVTAIGEEITNANYEVNDALVKQSKSITVTKPSANKPTKPTEDHRSKENALSALSVNVGQLSPAFQPTTTKYTVNVDGQTTQITISAKAKDAKAKVTGTGTHDLKIGKNTFIVKCIAENGSPLNYTIEVNVDEKPLVYVDYNDQKLGVVRNLSDVTIPSGFQKTTATLSLQEVDAWMNEKLGLTICYLMNESGEKEFYVVENGKVQYLFQRVEIDGRIFIVPHEDNMKEREGFIFKKVTVQESEFDGWVYEDPAMSHYFQLYLMNENGEKSFYDYETTENQLQKYTELTKEKEPFNMFIVTTGVFAVTTAALFGYMMLNKKKR